MNEDELQEMALKAKAERVIERRRSRSTTYTNALPAHTKDRIQFLKDFYRTFYSREKTQFYEDERKTYPVVEENYQRLCGNGENMKEHGHNRKKISPEDFWQRYEYRCCSIERVMRELAVYEAELDKPRIVKSYTGMQSPHAQSAPVTPVTSIPRDIAKQSFTLTRSAEQKILSQMEERESKSQIVIVNGAAAEEPTSNHPTAISSDKENQSDPSEHPLPVEESIQPRRLDDALSAEESYIESNPKEVYDIDPASTTDPASTGSQSAGLDSNARDVSSASIVPVSKDEIGTAKKIEGEAMIGSPEDTFDSESIKARESVAKGIPDNKSDASAGTGSTSADDDEHEEFSEDEKKQRALLAYSDPDEILDKQHENCECEVCVIM